MILRRLTRRAALGAVALVAFWTVPLAARAGEATIFAAASLKDALDEIAVKFEEETGHALVASLGASPALARQIRQGAPADVFVSASPDWMDALATDGLVDAASRVDLLHNRIVLIAHGKEAAPVAIGPGFGLAALLGEGRLAMAMVDSVPAGVYGKAALTTLGVWDAVAPQVAQAENVRAALALVARGEAPYGVVYATDAAASDDVTVVGRFPVDSHPPIVYPAATVAASANPLKAGLLAFLRGPAARAAFERQGFVVAAD